MEAEFVENSLKNVLRVTVYVFLGLVFLGVLFWALFYSTEFANFQPIISLRNLYQGSLLKAFPSQSGQPMPQILRAYYTIHVRIKDPDGSYIYSFWGKLTGLKTPGGQISVSGIDGKSYVFKAVQYFNGSEFNLTSVKTADNEAGNSINIPAYGIPQTNNNRFIEIVWHDKRTLNKLYQDYYSNPINPLNVNSEDVLSLHFLGS